MLLFKHFNKNLNILCEQAPSCNFSTDNLRLLSFLSQKDAALRAKHFNREQPLDYDITIKINKGDTYEGQIDVNFNLNNVSKELFMDYAGNAVENLSINNNQISSNSQEIDKLREGRSLILPGDALIKGENKASLRFSNIYTNDGNGLHSFVDVDKKQYIYSNSEPYHANKFIPCFDQPSLKGTMKMTVIAPKEWTVISNDLLSPNQDVNSTTVNQFLKEEEKNDFKVWHFDKTPPLSTYLYTMIAGPYHEIQCQNLYNNIPMSLYSRESRFDFLKRDADEIFEITIESMKFFERYFGYPFPFTKYDQIFCPEYNIGAMENPGAVTFNDLYLFKENVTRKVKANRANTISHELSHMWFGDLVTMEWWNGLWLNESFADFISHLCLANVDIKTTELEDAFHMFFQNKDWAYREDQLESTHPIATDVRNTEEAENIFDGITYTKGASTLKQLLCLIGKENFSKGVSKYFNEFAWKNTTLPDFIKHLEAYYQPNDPNYPASLKVWQQDWLEKAGLNECYPEWDPKSSTLKIRQTAAMNEHDTLRFHKMKMAFFDNEGNIIGSQDLVIKNTKYTTVELPKFKEGEVAAILLNYEDEAFIKVRLDSASFDFFRKNVSKVKDEFTRSLIWRALYDMLRDGDYTSIGFLDAVCENLGTETSDIIMSKILQYTKESVDLYTPKKLRHILNHRVFDLVYRNLQVTPKENQNRVILFRNELLSFAYDDFHKQIIYRWFNDDWPGLKSFTMGIGNRWAAVRLAYQDHKLDSETKQKMWDRIIELDPSDTQIEVKKFIEAVQADTEEERDKLWESYLNPDPKVSNQLIAESMRGFNNDRKLEDLDSYYQDFWNKILQVSSTKSREYCFKFFFNLFPKSDELEDHLSNLNQLIEKCPEEQTTLIKQMLAKRDSLKRRIRSYNNLITHFRETKGHFK